MSETAQQASSSRDLAERLGFEPSQTVLVFGRGGECDQALRASVEEVTGAEVVNEEYADAVDVVLLWWRRDDGDLRDTLVRAKESLADGGRIWLLTPKVEHDGYVDPSEINDSGQLAGLGQTSSITLTRDWLAACLQPPAVM
ncbi:hypothetical protein GCM10010277_69610 [Streptomyces longisporoflavus]|uniref:DUF3052 domain-containing protein n=1 Tax=Streptomyces longisporoflavus TaxID=28044 RepID=UPI00167E4347|nr:DUF3052 domain-containing protein [Streptomyces longisporoflavus]GGV63493.1 hypothetical protein GCM10010277_69610 [Streptomyces longisporoflavus]